MTTLDVRLRWSPTGGGRLREVSLNSNLTEELPIGILVRWSLKVPRMPGQLLFFLKVRRLKLIFSKEKIRFEFFSRLYRPSNPPVNPENPQQQGDWVLVML